MQEFQIEKSKTLNAAFYVLNSLGEANCHRVFDILYFADQQHLKKYGRPITGDAYHVMNSGPVPFFLFEIMKAAEKGSSPYKDAFEMSASFAIRIDGKIAVVTALNEADIDELSESEIITLNLAIHDNRTFGYDEIVKLLDEDGSTPHAKIVDREISYLNIAKAADTSDDMLAYLMLNAENDQELY